MLRGILNSVLGGGRKATATRRPARGRSRPGTNKGSTGEVGRGARTLFRGLSRRRRSL